MEPCLFRHGKRKLTTRKALEQLELQWSHVFSDMVRCATYVMTYRLQVLQWSHVFSDMVRRGPGRRHTHVRPASMEPCLFRHGKALEQEANKKIRGILASMEPCLFRHGKSVYVSPERHHALLQWSHVFSDMVRSASR